MASTLQVRWTHLRDSISGGDQEQGRQTQATVPGIREVEKGQELMAAQGMFDGAPALEWFLVGCAAIGVITLPIAIGFATWWAYHHVHIILY